MNLCPVDGRPVEIIMDLERLASSQPEAGWYDPGRSDLWRFGGLLPLDINDAGDQPHIFSRGEGHTPLLDFSDPLSFEFVGGDRIEVEVDHRLPSHA